MPIDHVASIMSLARTMRDFIDPNKEDVTVKAAQLRLLIDTFIEVGTASHVQVRADQQARTVMGMFTEIQTAVNDRDLVR